MLQPERDDSSKTPIRPEINCRRKPLKFRTLADSPLIAWAARFVFCRL
jgi:hypothetical protein